MINKLKILTHLKRTQSSELLGTKFPGPTMFIVKKTKKGIMLPVLSVIAFKKKLFTNLIA